MSAEKKFSSVVSYPPSFVTPEKSEEVSSSGRVDINILLNRARKVKEKEYLTNLILVGLALSLIFILGMILSF
jgi:preprotein translocase subunit Sss1